MTQPVWAQTKVADEDIYDIGCADCSRSDGHPSTASHWTVERPRRYSLCIFIASSDRLPLPRFNTIVN